MDGVSAAGQNFRMPQSFRCPICRCTQYVEVGKARNGRPIYACHSCSVLFSDVEAFTRFEPHASPNVKPDLKKHWR